MIRRCFKLLLLLVLVLAMSAQANMLTNGDFNTGDLSGWWSWIPMAPDQGVTIETAYTYDFTPNVMLWSNVAGDWARIGQDTVIGENMPYTLSCVYNVASTTDSVGIGVKYLDDGWGEIGWEWIVLSDTGVQWLTYSGDFTTVPETAHIEITFQVGDLSTAYFDDIVLVPEPATIALMALGGLTILRKRK